MQSRLLKSFYYAHQRFKKEREKNVKHSKTREAFYRDVN